MSSPSCIKFASFFLEQRRTGEDFECINLWPPIMSHAALNDDAVRSPKTAELVPAALRRMIVDCRLTDGDFLPNAANGAASAP